MGQIDFPVVLIAVILSVMSGCKNNSARFLVDEIPGRTPLDFKKELIPDNKIIHRGIFSPDMEEYYFTISDKNYAHFDVFMIEKKNDKWSEPQEAFFNSPYSEHGMSFSADGKTLYFSSTRPVPVAGVAATWHIWKSEQVHGTWNAAQFVDIPNLRDKLVSHPSAARSGTIYFHAANPDYSDMDIYCSKQAHGKFENAEKVRISTDLISDKCTPYISANEDYLLFAAIGDQLDLWICFNNGNGKWTNTKKLDVAINRYGQGNPYVTPDNGFLFFATGKHLGNWSVKWVAFKPGSMNH